MVRRALPSRQFGVVLGLDSRGLARGVAGDPAVFPASREIPPVPTRVGLEVKARGSGESLSESCFSAPS